MDGLISDFGYSQDVQVGVENPLVNVLAEGEEMSSSEQGSTTEDGFQVSLLIFTKINVDVYQMWIFPHIQWHRIRAKHFISYY